MSDFAPRIRSEPASLSLSGAASLTVTGQPGVRLERKLAALLAWLHVVGPSPRGKLAGLLWPEASATGARSNLRQCIARLRRLDPEVLVDNDDLLSLSPWVTIEPPAPSGAMLLAAYDYSDCDEFARWLNGRHDDERARRRTTLVADVRSAIQRGDLGEAEARADALLALDRESEDSYRALMEVSYLRGDFAAAIAVWDRCRHMLRTLYGVKPSTTTEALGATILAASRVLGRAPAAPAPALPPSISHPPLLIGRTASLEALVAGWRAGQTVCVAGEAGIGKSRLLAELAGRLGDCVSVAARPGDGARPYATLTRLVAVAIDRFRPPLDDDSARWAARLLPGIAYLVAGSSPVPPQTERELQLALRGVREMLAACTRRGCVVLMLDDLQFADRATIEALPSLVDAAEPGEDDVAPRFAFGSRADDADAPGARMLDALAESRGFLRVALAPLAGAEVAALVKSLALPGLRTIDLPRRLFAQVGGNPAFVLESLKLVLSLDDGLDDAAAIPVPPGIDAVIARRIELLGAPARHIAQLAAIAESAFTVEMAATALASPIFALDEPLRELERRQVLSGRQFAHDLVAAAVARSIPASVAEFMHRFVADYLEASGGDPGLVAGHWRACSEWRRAGAAYCAAAATAREQVRPREQAEFLDAAIECFETAGDDGPLFDAIEERLKVPEVADRALVRGRLNERLAALASTEEQQIRVLLYQGSFLSDHARIDSLPRLADGLRRARALGQTALAFEFAETIAHLLGSHARLAEAVDLLGSFDAWLGAVGDVRLRGRQQRALGLANAYGDRLAPSIAHGERAIALFRSIGDDLRALPTMSNVGLALHWRGELAASRAVYEEALLLRDRLHGGLSRTMLDVNLAAVLRDLGEFGLADERLRQIGDDMRATLAASPDEPATDLAITENHHAQLWLMLGRPDHALALMRADDGGIDPRFRLRRLALRLRAARMRCDDTSSLDQAGQALLEGIDSSFHPALFELEALRSRPAAEALAGFERLHGAPAVAERPGLQLQAALLASDAALGAGDLARARRWIESAWPAMAAVPPYDMDTDEAWRIAARVLVGIGESGDAARAARDGDAAIAAVAKRLPPAWRTDYLRSRSR